MARRARASSESGQSTVEWVGLILLVSAALALLAALAGFALPGAALARALVAKLACAVDVGGCAAEREGALRVAYGDELGEAVAAHAPAILYEPGMKALPVDYRHCREDACADGAGEGEVWRSHAGHRTVAFVRVIDCRPGSPTAASTTEASCSGASTGQVYIQYWVYYPGSATGEGSIAPGAVRALTGGRTYHPDDWESFTVRIGPEGTYQRASSHHGYGSGWVPENGAYFVAGGSHAGSATPRYFDRATPPSKLRLIPLEPIAASHPDVRFEVTPPWLKKVWREPEYEGTD